MEFCTRVANQVMLKKIQEDFSENIVSSPLSINAVLNMVAAGTTGHTLKNILDFLGSKNIDEINSKSRKMMAVAAGCGDGGSFENVGDGPILTVVNGVWVDERFPLVPKFKEEVLKGIFKCEANNVDFRTKANQVVDEINSWANIASRGLIKDILSPGSISRETTLILANALYFKGIWDRGYEFDARWTRNRKFYLLNGSTLSVPFMTSNNSYCCRSFDGFKVLQIPYQSVEPNYFSMYFFLPDEQDGLPNLLAKFNSEPGVLNQKYFELTKKELDKFWIPKFKFSFDFDVSEVVDSLGEPLSLIKNPRDLSEMLQNSEDVPFFTSGIFQKAYIEVDEKGTEAAAITICMKSTGGGCRMLDIKRFSFVADHPFLFMIREESSGLIIFTGAVLNPVQEH
ncbi:hypothetical protein Vadar_022360 [Vaccinium darrowii]|uniref:Uncharacterized protein n=1 Tax=Vaccinium darrowii TaxID=229202 RepID=A0ACB7Y9M2_9ERIC|nr:hypothetical protein Vadar_022360 [Vaccinium darrowii]